MILNIFFLFLILYTIVFLRSMYLEKSLKEWILDIINLSIQGTLIPYLASVVLALGFSKLIPNYQSTLDISPLLSFLINFIFLDYLYYWNHRILHKKSLLPLHIVHHTVTEMDVLATSRNTLWTSFILVYLWFNAFMLYILKDPSAYLISMSLSAGLDLWKHSKFLTNQKRLLEIISKYFFIMTPIEHAWHHSQKININFGANLNLFDKVHKTYSANFNYPEKLGLNTRLSFWKKCFYPF